MKKIKSILGCKLFQGIAEEDFLSIFEETHYQIKEFEEGNIIAHAGEEVKYLIIVMEGSVKGEMLDFSGKAIKIENIDAPQTIAQAFLFGKTNFFPVNVVATIKSRLVYISKIELLKMLQKNQQLMLNYLNIISSRAQFLSEKIKFLSFNTLKEKVANFILQLARGEELNVVELPTKQQELAELFGVTRPSLGRTFNELKQEGIIMLEKGIITIQNREKLIEIINT